MEKQEKTDLQFIYFLLCLLKRVNTAWQYILRDNRKKNFYLFVKEKKNHGPHTQLLSSINSFFFLGMYEFKCDSHLTLSLLAQVTIFWNFTRNIHQNWTIFSNLLCWQAQEFVYLFVFFFCNNLFDFGIQFTKMCQITV